MSPPNSTEERPTVVVFVIGCEEEIAGDLFDFCCPQVGVKAVEGLGRRGGKVPFWFSVSVSFFWMGVACPLSVRFWWCVRPCLCVCVFDHLSQSLSCSFLPLSLSPSFRSAIVLSCWIDVSGSLR